MASMISATTHIVVRNAAMSDSESARMDFATTINPKNVTNLIVFVDYSLAEGGVGG